MQTISSNYTSQDAHYIFLLNSDVLTNPSYTNESDITTSRYILVPYNVFVLLLNQGPNYVISLSHQ